MTVPVESRAGELLRARIAARGTTAAAVAEALGLPPGEVAELIEGRQRLDLARLDLVLSHLGVAPGDFFAELYAAPPAAPPAPPAPPAEPRPGADEPIPRKEVEALLAELRGMIDGIVRVLDAESLLGGDDRGGG
jgi:transcriptional regulator with XRE-family HTH domain